MEKSQELPWYQKLIEFYFKTPMTKFYANVVSVDVHYFILLRQGVEKEKAVL